MLTKKRANELLINALIWIDEVVSKSELHNTLTRSLGMTDEEINKMGFGCPHGGDPSNDCSGCANSGEYHFKDGDCVLREDSNE